MKNYTFTVSFDITVSANDEEWARDKAYEYIPWDAEHERVELYEVEDYDHEGEEADRIHDERHL